MLFIRPIATLTTLSLLTLLALSNTTYAQIYKTTDKNGNPIFSDTASDGQAINIKTTNTIPAVSPSPPQQKPKPDNKSRYQALNISSPTDGGIIANGLSPFVISVSLSPALRRGHQLVLTIDGVTHSSSSTQFSIDKISRGSHTVEARIIDQQGKTLITSPSNSFFVYWPRGG